MRTYLILIGIISTPVVVASLWLKAAQQQRAAVEAIEKNLLGICYYSWQVDHRGRPLENYPDEPPLSPWFVSTFGRDFFYPIARLEPGRQLILDAEGPLTTLPNRGVCRIGMAFDASNDELLAFATSKLGRSFHSLELIIAECESRTQLAQLATCTNIGTLYFDLCRFPLDRRNDLIFLTKNPELRYLVLERCSVAPDAWSVVPQIPNLQHLVLNDVQMTDQSALRFRGFPALEKLHLGRVGLELDALGGLSNPNELTQISIISCPVVNDEFLKQFKAFTQLRFVTLMDVPISGAGLEYLKDCPQLEELILDECPLEPIAFDILNDFKQLKLLKVPIQSRTADELLDLQQQLPNTTVECIVLEL